MAFAYFVSLPLSSIGIVLLLMKKNTIVDIIVVIFGIVTLLDGIILRITPRERPMGYVGTPLIVPSLPYIIIGFLYLIKHIEEKSKREKSEKEEKDILEFEEIIYNYLKSNINRAFTAKSIMVRVFSNRLANALKELVESSLENLVKRGKIQLTQKENEIIYFF